MCITPIDLYRLDGEEDSPKASRSQESSSSRVRKVIIQWIDCGLHSRLLYTSFIQVYCM